MYTYTAYSLNSTVLRQKYESDIRLILKNRQKCIQNSKDVSNIFFFSKLCATFIITRDIVQRPRKKSVPRNRNYKTINNSIFVYISITSLYLILWTWKVIKKTQDDDFTMKDISIHVLIS